MNTTWCSKQDYFYNFAPKQSSSLQNRKIQLNQTPKMAKANTVSNMEETKPDGEKVFTLQWLSRYKQYTIQEHRIDILPFIKGEGKTDTKNSAQKN